MTVPVRGSSYVSIAYDEIRRLILAGELAPGVRVTVRPLVDRLDLSPTPIRAALATLERQGMLEIREHRGYFVPTLGRDDMLEIYELRGAIDSIAARQVSQSSDRDVLVGRLTELLDQQRGCVDDGEIDAYADLDQDFHRAIWDASGNRRLASICENLVGQLRIGNNISARVPGRPAASLSEHRAIIDGIVAGDPDSAERAARQHVERAREALSEMMSADDEP